MSVSINPLNGSVYQLPDVLDDKANIESFLDANHGKKVVVVQGLGFVGAVMSLVCANAVNGDYAVIGVDIGDEKNFWKIASINEGIFPLVADDPNIEELYRQALSAGNFYATYDPNAYAYPNSCFNNSPVNRRGRGFLYSGKNGTAWETIRSIKIRNHA